ncbi:hypothetical protein CDO51_00700 [Natranaerobius trueperi]|uniref:Peptidase S8 n=1 Tax=Natranaerobius trueperi TaxID=759412 RepID=A0A226C3F1_9FIRM|nr:hypothetical protein CDO51_00700 [Natranaerobius trueperi]
MLTTLSVLMVSTVLVGVEDVSSKEIEDESIFEEKSNTEEQTAAFSVDDLLKLYEVESKEELNEPLNLVIKLQTDSIETQMRNHPNEKDEQFLGSMEDQYESRIKKEQDEFKKSITDLDIEIKHNYKEVINGFSAIVDKRDLDKLFQLPQVKKVYPVGKVKAKGHRVYPELKVEDSWDLGPYGSLRGNGVNVAILDTGVDYKHPDLGGGFGSGYKVVDGYDYVNRRSYPLDDEGHGTHVAGLIAGDGDLQGVAPDANILAYKVLDSRGEGSTDDILAALEQIVSNRRRGLPNAADVINMSFGSSDPHVGQLIAKTLESAVEQGISVVLAAGNNGPGDNTLDYPDHFEDYEDSIITVGASGKGADQVRINAPNVNGTIFGELMLYSPAPDFLTKKIVHISGGESYRDFTTWFGKSKVDNKIALVERGNATYREISQNAKEAGAKAVIIYNDEPGMFYGSLVEPGDYIPTISIPREEGLNIKNQINSGSSWASMRTSSRIADFSSRGYSSAKTLKPDLVAPGKKVLSTWLARDYSWSEGTSVSAAFVSGSIALMKQEHSHWSPEKIKAALMNTSEPLTNSLGERYELSTQGAGEIRTYDALTTDTVVTPGSLNFKAIDIRENVYEDSESLTIHNTSRRTRRYRARINFENSHYNLIIDPSVSSFTVPGGAERNIDIDLKAYAEDLPKGKYKGTIEIEDVTGGESLEIPFMAVKDLRKVNKSLDLEVSPLTVSDNQTGEININFFEPMEELEVVLYDENQNQVDTLYNRTNLKRPRTLSYPWEGETSDGATLESGFYFLDVYGLPSGEDPFASNSWENTSQLVAIDREPPELIFSCDTNTEKEVDTSHYTLSGRVEDLSFDMYSQGVTLKINGEDVNINENQSFEYNLDLEPGDNLVEIKAKDWAQNINEKELLFYYDPYEIDVNVKGGHLTLDVPPVVDNGRTLIPIKALGDALGAQISYGGPDEPIKINKLHNEIQIYLDSNTSYLNGEPINLGTKPMIINERTMIPIREVAEVLGTKVYWNEDSRTVIIENDTSYLSFLETINPNFYLTYHLFVSNFSEVSSEYYQYKVDSLNSLPMTTKLRYPTLLLNGRSYLFAYFLDQFNNMLIEQEIYYVEDIKEPRIFGANFLISSKPFFTNTTNRTFFRCAFSCSKSTLTTNTHFIKFKISVIINSFNSFLK